MMTSAPESFANWRAKIETPPVPSTKTVSPAFNRPETASAFQAVTQHTASVAPSSYDKWSGMRTTDSSPKVPYARKTPSQHGPAPERRAPLFFAYFAVEPLWAKIGKTRSPAFHLVTPSPTSTISPAPSENGTAGIFIRGL